MSIFQYCNCFVSHYFSITSSPDGALYNKCAVRKMSWSSAQVNSRRSIGAHKCDTRERYARLLAETGAAISDCLHARALPGCRLPFITHTFQMCPTFSSAITTIFHCTIAASFERHSSLSLFIYLQMRQTTKYWLNPCQICTHNLYYKIC